MTATATTSTWKSPSHGRSQSRSSRPTTTPRAYPSAASVGQAMPPPVSSPTRSPPNMKTIRSPDGGYFGFVVNDETIPPDSNPGAHVKQNWNFSHSSTGSATPLAKHKPNDINADFEAFRRESEQNHRFNLGGSNLATLRRESSQNTPQLVAKQHLDSPTSPTNRRPAPARMESSRKEEVNPFGLGTPAFNISRQDSPAPLSPLHASVIDHQHARLSLPTNELKLSLDTLKPQRSNTLPPPGESGTLRMASVQEVAQVLETRFDSVLVFDLRVYQQYAVSRLRGALNLCLPTTLLKRPTFTVPKIAETFTSAHDKEKFEKWRGCEYLVVYDGSSTMEKEAIMPFNVLKKFSSDGWKGKGLVVKGGFSAFSKMMTKQIEHGPVRQVPSASTKSVEGTSPSENVVPVAGGCFMPATKSAANPFFGNIRQNMDLLDGVGQIPIKKPAGMSESENKRLPRWLRDATSKSDEGKKVSDSFLEIEKSEQRRMQQALSAEVSYGTPRSDAPKRVQVAGIEKGAKNRYNNIFPYEHSRVKLQGVPQTGCDYVNANYVKAQYSNRRYIATQAPIPGTFEDFWRVVWEQDVKVIVMLTAEAEGGQVKSHPYWNSGEYGQFKLKKLSDRSISLDKPKSKDKGATMARPSLHPRRSSQPDTTGERQLASEHNTPLDTEAPTASVRHFSLSHSGQPFQPMHEVTQIQYTQWPDFGAPASPLAILGLIDYVNKYIRQSAKIAARPEAAAPSDERPIIVHCSAGCGRTGTFCTVDSVIDMLKQQKLEKSKPKHHNDDMEVDVPENWIAREDIDLVVKTVSDFRQQRLSMVQNLRQFVLCYESILQWFMATSQHQNEDDPRTRFMREGSRRSYQGTLGS